MPELPEVETIKEALVKSIKGATIFSVTVNNRNLRQCIPLNFAKIVHQTKIVHIYRISKYIVLDLSNKYSIILHFGMSGKIRFIDQENPVFEKHDHVIFDTSHGLLTYNDPRRFGLILILLTNTIPSYPPFTKLGPDPFDKKLDVSYLKNKFKNKKLPIKVALLDQSIICGIGNIYASEALYSARISPLRFCDNITEQELQTLIFAIRETLSKAIKAGGSTLHDYRKPDGSTGYFQLQHAVYGKEGQTCPDCVCSLKKCKGIQKVILDGRSTFYCPYLQK